MNCPSRNDDIFLHPDWNQSPPRLAADLTTRSDLNGIANARELGDAYCLRNEPQAFGSCDSDDRNFQDVKKECPAVGEGVKGSYKGTFRW
jgi:zinc transporter 1/2/3